MIIAADIGNTNIKIGLFDKDRLVKSWRISTDVHRTSDEHGSILKQLFFAAEGVGLHEASSFLSGKSALVWVSDFQFSV